MLLSSHRDRALYRTTFGSILVPLVVSLACTSEEGTSGQIPAGNAGGAGSASIGGASDNTANGDVAGGTGGTTNASAPDGVGGQGSLGGASATVSSGGASSVSAAVGGNANSSSLNRGGATSATSTGGRVGAGQGGTGQGGMNQGGRSSTRFQGGAAGRMQSGSGGAAAGSRAQGGASVAQGGASLPATGGVTGGGSSGLSTFAQQFVDAHNAVRSAVTEPAGYTGTWVPIPNVTWSDTVAASAQTWVNHLRDVENCGLVHEGGGTGYGENLASGTNLSPQAAVDMWASEKSKYTWSAKYTVADFNLGSGHYTQVVWRKSIQIGCASATCGKNVVISCRYSPPGNVTGGTQSVY
ncbi:MAG TPA: CAP domain-containing protein [Polyangiaceae bacterium]